VNTDATAPPLSELELPPMSALHCQARKSRDCKGKHGGQGALLLKMHGRAIPAGRVLWRYEDVLPPRKPDGSRYIGLRCADCKLVSEFRVVL
jgi:hypothetical protein